MNLFSDAVPAQVRNSSVTLQDTGTSVVGLNDEYVRSYGANLISNSTAISDKVIADSNSDGGEFGKKLGQLMAVTKGFDPKALAKSDSVIAWARSGFLSARERFAASFRTFSKQIEVLQAELEKHVDKHKKRQHTLQALFVENGELYRGLRSLVAAGNSALEAERGWIAQLPQAADGLEAQCQADRRHIADRFGKRLHDLDICMTLSLQTGAQIQMMRDDGQTLIDKFATLTEVTIPAWERQFALYLLMMEQAQSVKVAQSIDDATNDAIRRNAVLVGENAQNIAAASQRSVVDLDTIQFVHKEFIEALEDSNRIYEEGEKRRESEAQALRQLREDFVSRVSGKH